MSGADADALSKLLRDGWDYHDKDSERLACELEAAAEQAVGPEVHSFLHLANHTIGEHLGDWPRALTLSKRVLAGQSPVVATARAWGWLYVAAALAGDSVAAADAELCYLKAAGADFGVALLDMRFMLVGALVSAKRAGGAAGLYRSALDLVGRIPQSPLLDRTIAVASNNLGWELFEKPSRSTDETALMQLAADTSLDRWRKSGNWINEERGLYLKARVANATGHSQAALTHANDAIAIIATNGQRPLDAALLHLARAVSLAALADPSGAKRAISDADAAAAKLTDANLQAQYAAERGKVVAGEI